MQQPIEERVTSLESTAERHEQRLARLDAIIESQDQLMDRMQANLEALQANQVAILSLLEELTRDAATTRRLWLRLAQRYGWLDDEQNGAQANDPA